MTPTKGERAEQAVGKKKPVHDRPPSLQEGQTIERGKPERNQTPHYGINVDAARKG